MRLALAALDASELRARLAANAAERVRLERHLDHECLRVYVSAVHGRSFSSVELFRHQVVSLELREVFAAAGIRSARQLGKQLARLAQRGGHAGWRLARVGADNQGAIWVVRVREHSHLDACPPAPTRTVMRA